MAIKPKLFCDSWLRAVGLNQAYRDVAKDNASIDAVAQYESCWNGGGGVSGQIHFLHPLPRSPAVGYVHPERPGSRRSHCQVPTYSVGSEASTVSLQISC